MSGALAENLCRLATRRRQVDAGQSLFHAQDPVRNLYIVELGHVRLSRSLGDGAEITLQDAGAGQLLAEASIFSARYHCDAIASAPSTLAVISLRRLREELQANSPLNTALLGHLAHELQRARAQAQLLALKTVAARVEGWLAINGGTLPPKGQWRTLATHIAVSPEALYRELAREKWRR